jgi:type VI secretion system secreted protein VgrG
VSNCQRLIPGFLFEVTEHSFESLDGKYLLVKVAHTGSQNHVLGEHAGMGGDATYSNEFVAIPAGVTPRPERLLAKPRAELQSAFVVGPSGEEIYPDEYGRVKVRFHWDRLGDGTENSSCWLRVNQPWSGQGWGMSALPRVGDEVLVAFINGDPDWPVVVGSVNNAESPALYPLPEERARSGIRTRSYPEGGSDNFHELRFDDRKGHEEVYLQSERDWNILVKNDKRETVGNHGVEQIAGDKELHAGNCIRIQAGDSIELVCGSASIKMDSLGNLTVNGTRFDFSGSQHIRLTSRKIDLN